MLFKKYITYIIFVLWIFTGCAVNDTHEVREEKVRELGRQAAKAGISAEANPYLFHGPGPAEIWFEGYLEAYER